MNLSGFITFKAAVAYSTDQWLQAVRAVTEECEFPDSQNSSLTVFMETILNLLYIKGYQRQNIYSSKSLQKRI